MDCTNFLAQSWWSITWRCDATVTPTYNNSGLMWSLFMSKVANLAFLKPNFEIQAFLMHLAFFENQKIPVKIWLFYFFQSERLGFGKTISELYIQYKSFLTRVYDHAGCKEYCKDFTVVLKIFVVFNKKQMYDSMFTGKENASKNWHCIKSMFLTNFNIYFCLVMHVLRVAYMS